jgi:hypothetical protein
MADARAQAQKIAAAAGFPLGPVTGIGAAIAQPPAPCSVMVNFALGYSGRPGPQSINITASRTPASPPDEVVLSLQLDTDITSGFDEVSNMLAAVGITGATFVGAQTPFLSTLAPRLEWSFTLPAPLAKLNAVLAQLIAAQKTIPLTFYLYSVRTSAQSKPACPETGLVADARAQADKIAAAAGVSVGTIVSISDGVTTNYSVVIGDFLPVPLSPDRFTLSSKPQGFCSLAVQFQLL